MERFFQQNGRWLVVIAVVLLAALALWIALGQDGSGDAYHP